MELVENKLKPNFIRPEILLHPNIPKPLHGLNPRTILGQKWWDDRRQIAYAKNNYCCWACGIHKSIAKYHHWLEAHEMYEYNYQIGEAKLVEIVALCHSCHNYIHDGRMEMMVQDGDLTEEKFYDILKHGMTILTNAGFKIRKDNSEQRIAEWSKWHLLIDGKKFYTKFKDIEDWESFYRG